MAKQNINLTGSVADKADLLARATGAGGRPAGAPPPKPPPPPPRPPGPMAVTDVEREVLRQLGWQEGEPLPANVAAILADVRQQAPATPAAADPPPAALTPAQAAEARQRIQDEISRQQQAVATARAERAVTGMAPTVADAYRVATRPDEMIVVDDVGPAAAAATPTPAPPPPPPPPPPPAAAPATTPTPAAAAEASPTGAGGGQAFCPHCGWDLAQPDIAEPDYADKQSFLQSVLGLKPFLKRYELFGGEVVVTFRGLTTPEADTVHRQVLYEMRTGRVLSGVDFLERVQRYRLYLQLNELRATAFEYDLPDGLSPRTNPYAGSYWELPPPAAEGDEGLAFIEQHLLGQVLRTEALQAALTLCCNEFNRLESRLRAVVLDRHFWKATSARP